MSNLAPKCSCIVCKKEFSLKGIHKHYLVAHTVEGMQQARDAGSKSNLRSSLTKQQIEKLKRVEEYNKNPKSCKYCNIPINYELKHNQFCSASCSASHNNKLRSPRSVESKQKTRDTLSKTKPKQCFYPPKPGTCLICNNEHIRGNGKALTCSSYCQFKHQSEQQSLRLSNPEYRKRHNYGRGKKSWLEQSFEDWLKVFNISNYESEIKFYNPILKKNYFVDFLFEDLKLIIELDGTQHRHTIEQDKIRDEFLTSLDYHVIRITYEEYQDKSRIDEIKLKLGIMVSETGLEPACDFRLPD